MSESFWVWAAIIALLVLQFVVLHLTIESFKAVTDVLKTIRDILSGRE